MRGRINQETLAERLGTSQPGLSHWLNARSQPSLDDINRIADEIGVSRVWLTHGLGFEAGPGKLLLDLLMSATWSDEQLQPLALTAQALLKASPHNAMETADFAGKPKALAATPKSIAAKVPRA